MEPNDYQIGGDHYQGDYQPWDFILDSELPYLLGCVVKHIYRWSKKKEVNDLRKAVHYLNKHVCDAPKRIPRVMISFIITYAHKLLPDRPIEIGILIELSMGELCQAQSLLNKLTEVALLK